MVTFSDLEERFIKSLHLESEGELERGGNLAYKEVVKELDEYLKLFRITNIFISLNI